jgi:hypothetical protein
MLCRLSLLIAGLLAAVPLAQAQDSRAQLVGIVTDASGAAVPGLAVKIVNAATNVTTPATTNEAGSYDAPYLIPGAYSVSVEATGFKRYQRSGVELRAADRVRVDIRLEIGASTETITVAGAIPLLQTETASTGQVVDQRTIVDMPLSGGNAFTLTRMAPGVVNFAQVSHNSFAAAPQVMSRISVGGSTQYSTEFTVDGTPVMARNEASYVPPADLVQEFRVETNSYDAAVGRAAGGHVNVALRSGANRLHGTLYEFHHNDKLRGLDTFQRQVLYNPATGPADDEKKKSVNGHTVVNRFGGTISGPVFLPRVYNGRNRTFFIYGYEAILRPTISSGNYFSTVPDAAQRRGDFSGLLRLGAPYQVYDPATIAAEAGGRFRRQPFAGNAIPSSRLSSMAQSFLQYWPAPNTAGSADGRNNYFRPYPVRDDFSSHNVRIDHNAGDKHRMFARYNRTQYLFDTDQKFPNSATGTRWDRPYRGAGFDEVYVPSPSFLVNFRYGLSRNAITYHPFAQGFDLAAAGFPRQLVSQLDPRGITFPQIDIDQFASIGTSMPSGVFSTYHSFALNLTTVRSKHNLRYGAEHRLYIDSNYDLSYGSPRMVFGTDWTRGPLDNAAAAPIGQGLASYLLGIPTSGQLNVNASSTENSRFWALYFQDDWRISRRLTLNLGLRYDYDSPLVERYNRSVRGFDRTTANPVEAAVRAQYAASPIAEIPAAQFRVPGGLTFAGVGGQPRGLWDPDRNNLAPRVGLAYTLSPKTVVRAGYGLFYVAAGADQAAVRQTGFSQVTTLNPSLDNGLTFVATMANPFPNGFNQPVGASQGLQTNLGQAITAFSEGTRTGLLQRWSVDIQRELPRRILLDLAYAGSRGSGLGVTRQIDGIPAQYLSTSPARDQAAIDRLTATVNNPFYPLLPGTSLSGRTVARSQLLRPYPQFTGVGVSDSGGSSSYHAMQFRAERRFSQGLSLQGSYTWSKFIDAMTFLNPTDPDPARTISSLDRPQRLSVNGMFELPFGSGRPIGSSLRGVPNALVSGWQLQAVYEAQAGAPLGFGNSILLGSLADIPITAGDRTIARWFNTEKFERASARQLSQNIRTMSEQFAGIRSHGVNIWNASVMKVFRIREGVRLQFRSEFINAFNHTHLSAPNTSPTSTLFGTVSSAAGKPREIYFALKLLF